VETASGFVIFILSATSLTPFPVGSLTVVRICSPGSSDRVTIVRARLTNDVRLDGWTQTLHSNTIIQRGN